MAEEKTFTQEEVNKLVGQARLEGKEQGKKEFENYISPEELAKKTEDLSTQLGNLNDQLKELTDKNAELETQLSEKDGTIAAYERDSVKMKVVRELGLANGAEKFLQGEDEEAIRKSAEALKGLMGTGPAPRYNPEQPPEEDGVMKAFKEMNPNIKL